MGITRNMPRANRSAAAAPGVTNDITEGYVVGSEWNDTTNDRQYVCHDNTDGAAVWIESSSAKSAAAAPTVNDDITLGYTVGSKWTDTTLDISYVCLDNTDGAAVWEIISYIVDVVQASDADISSTDTLVLTFDFVPSEIAITYSARAAHDTSNEAGHTNGRAVVTITGTDTMTVNTNASGIYDNNGTMATITRQDDTTNTIYFVGGRDGVDIGIVTGVGTWDTGNKQLTITFTAADTTDATSYVELVATVYK